MAWGAAAVAATDTPAPSASAACLLAGAALALPLTAPPVQAGEFAATQIGYKHLYYDEKGRMQVNAPQVWFETNPDEDTQVGGSATVDTLSGASPFYVSNRSGSPVHTLSGASIREQRRDAELHARRNWGDANLGVSLAASRETDYISRSVAGDARFDFNERNTTLALGLGATEDDIGKHGSTVWRDRHTYDVLVGVTQVLSKVAIVQSNLTLSRGHGYFDDPYKYTLSFLGIGAPVVQQDARPTARRHIAWLTRYRHYLPGAHTALAADYRYYRDDWGVRAHTVDLSAARELRPGLSLVPQLRYHTQSAADFFAETFAARTATGSSDARLGAFGAWTVGLSLVWTVDAHSSIDFGAWSYRQRASYRFGGNGTANFPALDARFLMVGYTLAF
jgi:hypothetical protein